MAGFSKAEDVYGAIRDIDRIIDRNSPEKLDEVWHTLSQISKSDFDPNNVDKIISAIRDSLVKIYRTEILELSNEIGVEFEMSGLQKATVTNITKIS